ncbi:MAG: AbrB/MazE/SpoVT family DNA-binding domain-containing protein [Bacteroidota bacterium]
METSVVTVKGQIVIPKKIRKNLGITKGSKVAFIEKDGKIVLQPLNKNYFEGMAGVLGTEGRLLKSLMDDKKKEREL